MRVIYEVDAVARWGPYFIGHRIQLYCVIPASFMQRGCHRVAGHRLMRQPILTYSLPSITLQSALALDAIGCIYPPVQFPCVVLVRGAIKGHFCSLIQLWMTVEICCWTIQYKMIIKKSIFNQESIFKNERFNVPIVYIDTAQELPVKQLLAIQVCSIKRWSPQYTHAPGAIRIRSMSANMCAMQ